MPSQASRLQKGPARAPGAIGGGTQGPGTCAHARAAELGRVVRAVPVLCSPIGPIAGGHTPSPIPCMPSPFILPFCLHCVLDRTHCMHLPGPWNENPLSCFRSMAGPASLAGLPGCLAFDRAMDHGTCGRNTHACVQVVSAT